MKPCLDSLVLTEDEMQVAKKEIETLAFWKWKEAGCPDDASLDFWLEAELEWMEYRYVPDRYSKL